MARQREVRYVNFYSAGSAAYRIDPVPARQEKKAVLPAKPKPRRPAVQKIYVSRTVLAGLSCGVILLLALIIGVVQLTMVRQETAQLEKYVLSLQTENQRLSDTYHNSYDLEEIRQIAIARGMIPVEQAQHIYVPVSQQETVAQPSAWESIWIFLTGLFA